MNQLIVRQRSGEHGLIWKPSKRKYKGEITIKGGYRGLDGMTGYITAIQPHTLSGCGDKFLCEIPADGFKNRVYICVVDESGNDLTPQ